MKEAGSYKLKFKKLKNGLFSIRLFNDEKSYHLSVFAINKIRLMIDYNTEYLITKHGYNCKHIGY